MNPVQIPSNELEYVNHFLEEINQNPEPWVLTVDKEKGSITLVQGKHEVTGHDFIQVIEYFLGY